MTFHRSRGRRRLKVRPSTAVTWLRRGPESSDRQFGVSNHTHVYTSQMHDRKHQAHTMQQFVKHARFNVS